MRRRAFSFLGGGTSAATEDSAPQQGGPRWNTGEVAHVLDNTEQRFREYTRRIRQIVARVTEGKAYVVTSNNTLVEMRWVLSEKSLPFHDDLAAAVASEMDATFSVVGESAELPMESFAADIASGTRTCPTIVVYCRALPPKQPLSRQTLFYGGVGLAVLFCVFVLVRIVRLFV